MPKVVFKTDIERDAKNYYDAANSDIKWGNDFTKSLRPEVLEKLRGKKWVNVKKDTIAMLKRGYSKDKEKIENKLKEIEKSWRKIEKDYFKKLSQLTKHKIYKKEFIAFVTRIGRCPYFRKEGNFMINIYKTLDSELTTTAHEIMHLQFHHYFEEQLRKELSHEQFHNLKEALTVLLNIEFGDLFKEKDAGYPSHKELREFIVNEWKKQKDFDVLLEKCVEKLKEIKLKKR